jgi:hypothetical protein
MDMKVNMNIYMNMNTEMNIQELNINVNGKMEGYMK